MAKSYRVNEIFYSLQGEGYHTGTPSVFLRFSGCNLCCPFCDTDFDSYTELSASRLVAELAKFPARRVVVTGGEPLLQLDRALVRAIKAAGFYMQVETNGTRQFPDGVDWVTCSPKSGAIPVIDPDDVCELKMVYTGQPEAELEAMRRRFETISFLQPCSCANNAETIAYILAHPKWRLSLQTHKLVNIK